MMIEIKGVQFVNKGAELMLHAVLQQIRVRWPDSELVLASNVNSPYLKRAKLGAYQKISFRKNVIDLNALSYWIPRKVRLWFKKNWGIVFESDISVVLDASGFAYGDQWNTVSIQNLTSEIKRAAKNKKKYIILPQALGPFTRKNDIDSLSKYLSKASLICARERTSYDSVEKIIGKSNNLIQYPDFTNLVVGILPDYFVSGSEKVLIIPNSNMMSPRNMESSWRDNYLRVLCDSVKMIRRQNLIPVLLNHEGAGDGAICEKVNEMSGGNIEIIHEENPLKVKGIIGASRGVICSRFHGCVSALSQGVPCLGTSWSHKYQRLYEEYLLSECLIGPTITLEQLSDRFIEAIALSQTEDRKNIRDGFKLSSKAMWDRVSLTMN